MRATAWYNGTQPSEPDGYGIKLSPRDRDKYFDRAWGSVTVEMQGATSAEVQLSPSFWRSCSELRSAEIGRWLLESGAAPWPNGSPPGIGVAHVADNHFVVHVLKRHTLGQR